MMRRLAFIVGLLMAAFVVACISVPPAGGVAAGTVVHAESCDEYLEHAPAINPASESYGTWVPSDEKAPAACTVYGDSPVAVDVARSATTTRERLEPARELVAVFSGTSVAAKFVDEVTNVLIAAPRQLQAKFKHAADFGVTGNYSKANGAQFNAAIQEHINAAGTQSIRGTYRGDAVTHFLDPQTGLNVISRDGTFVSGWRLNADQLANVLRDGSLGGG